MEGSKNLENNQKSVTVNPNPEKYTSKQIEEGAENCNVRALEISALTGDIDSAKFDFLVKSLQKYPERLARFEAEYFKYVESVGGCVSLMKDLQKSNGGPDVTTVLSAGEILKALWGKATNHTTHTN